jgi:hypothetical protein
VNPEILFIAGTAAVVVLAVSLVYLKKRPKKINTSYCAEQWQLIQKNCSDKSKWPIAVTEADRLLDEVLKRRHYKGKTTGERLVSAQHDFTNNESLWFGHKLYNRIKDDGLSKLSKQDTLEALGGFRQALKDLGALQDKIITAPVEPKPSTIIVEPAKKPVKKKVIKNVG